MGDFLGLYSVASVDNEYRALPRENLCNAFTNAFAAAGYEGDLTLESEVYDVVPVSLRCLQPKRMPVVKAIRH